MPVIVIATIAANLILDVVWRYLPADTLAQLAYV